jgi:hypothetical protein
MADTAEIDAPGDLGSAAPATPEDGGGKAEPPSPPGDAEPAEPAPTRPLRLAATAQADRSPSAETAAPAAPITPVPGSAATPRAEESEGAVSLHAGGAAPAPVPVPAEEPPIAAQPLAHAAAPVPIGIVHPPAKRHAVYYVAAGMAGVALVSTYPAVREIAAHLLGENSPGIDAWAPLVLLLAVVQLAYVVYVTQLPDWSTTRVLMVITVVVAMVYASVLGFSVTAAEDNQLISSLGLTNAYRLKQITAWCFLILLLMCSLAYFWARVTFHWQKEGRPTPAARG